MISTNAHLPQDQDEKGSLYDDDLATVETLGGGLRVTDPYMIARYKRWLEMLREVAVTGAEAAEMFEGLQ